MLASPEQAAAPKSFVSRNACIFPDLADGSLKWHFAGKLHGALPESSIEQSPSVQPVQQPLQQSAEVKTDGISAVGSIAVDVSAGNDGRGQVMATAELRKSAAE